MELIHPLKTNYVAMTNCPASGRDGTGMGWQEWEGGSVEGGWGKDRRGLGRNGGRKRVRELGRNWKGVK